MQDLALRVAKLNLVIKESRVRHPEDEINSKIVRSQILLQQAQIQEEACGPQNHIKHQYSLCLTFIEFKAFQASSQK